MKGASAENCLSSSILKGEEGAMLRGVSPERVFCFVYSTVR